MKHLTILSGGLILALTLVGCGGDEPEPEPVIRPVRYIQVEQGNVQSRTFAGTAKAGAETALSFRVGGTVRLLTVEVGDRVSAGQLIAALDAGDYRIQMQQAQANLAQAQAQQRNASAAYERTQGLYENNNASRSDLDAARAAFESAAASVRATESQLQLAEQQLSYTQLRASTAGQVAQVLVEVNENVGSGTPIVVITSGDRPEVEVAVPETFISQIRQGLPVSAQFNALPGQTFDAVVSEVGVTSTQSTTFPVTARLVRNIAAIRPGMAVEVQFQPPTESADANQRIYIPGAAVGEDRNGRFVYAIQPESEDFGLIQRRTVEIGELTEGGLEITSGLAPGDYVATAGLRFLADGQKVRLLPQ